MPHVFNPGPGIQLRREGTYCVGLSTWLITSVMLQCPESKIRSRISLPARCGTVTVTSQVSEEPHPRDIHLVGQEIGLLDEAVLQLLAAWLRCAGPAHENVEP